MVERLNSSPESKQPSVSMWQILRLSHLRATKGGRLVVTECVFRHRPNEVRGDLHVLGERTLIRERSAVNESRDMVADLEAGDALPDFHDVAGVVATKDGSRDP